MPQDVHVKVRIGKPLGTRERLHVSPNNTGLECKVFLTAYSDTLDRESLDREMFAVLASMLFAMSMRSDEEVLAIIEATAKNGLLTKLNGGRSYDEVASLLDGEHYQACRVAPVANRAIAFAPFESPELAAPTGPGPGYDHADALDNVASRYENISDLYSLTLGRVVADERAHRLLEDLRTDGWLDWHLVAAIAAIATNHRANRLGYYRDGVKRAAADALFNTKENAESLVVPLQAFDEESFALTLRGNASAVAAGFGLTPPTQTPNFDAMLDILRSRYGYFTDDVVHLDLLGPDLLDKFGHARQMILASK